MMLLKIVISKQISKIVDWGKFKGRRMRVIREINREDLFQEVRGDFFEEVVFKSRFKVEKGQLYGELRRLVIELFCLLVKLCWLFVVFQVLREGQQGWSMVGKLVFFCEY